MRTHVIHPVSSLATATVILGACLLSGMQQPGGMNDEKRDILRHMTIVYLPDGLGGTAKTIRFTGVNVQVVNGLDSTNGKPSDPDSVLNTAVNSVGNLLVGYNELGNPLGFGDDRTGSHNIVVGHGNNYTSFGGFVGPLDNMTSAPFASVTGGRRNTASGEFSSISGGRNNATNGHSSSISGGRFNTASGEYSSVSGGGGNVASGYYSSISGGRSNTASGYYTSVSGGQKNVASWGNYYTAGGSVSGGRNNTRIGDLSGLAEE